MSKFSKLFTIIIICTMVLVNLSGCGFNNVNKLKRTLENSLEEKYGEEFYCYHVWVNGGQSYWGVCSPKSNHDIRFTSLFFSGGKISYDTYYDSCIAEMVGDEVQAKLEDIFIDCYVHTYIHYGLVSKEDDDIPAQKVKNNSLDINEYIALSDKKDNFISLIMLVNSDNANKQGIEDEYDKLSAIVKDVEETGFNPIVYLRFLPEREYKNCIEHLEIRDETNSTFDEMVRDYPFQIPDTNMMSIKFDFEGEDTLTLTKSDYIKQRNLM